MEPRILGGGEQAEALLDLLKSSTDIGKWSKNPLVVDLNAILAWGRQPKFKLTTSGLHGHVVVDLRRNSKAEEVSVIGRDRGANDRLDAALIALKRGILDG